MAAWRWFLQPLSIVAGRLFAALKCVAQRYDQPEVTQTFNDSNFKLSHDYLAECPHLAQAEVRAAGGRVRFTGEPSRRRRRWVRHGP